MIDLLKAVSSKFGLRISLEKTKIQMIGNLDNDIIQLEEHYIEEVDNFTYLENIQSNSGDIKKLEIILENLMGSLNDSILFGFQIRLFSEGSSNYITVLSSQLSYMHVKLRTLP